MSDLNDGFGAIRAANCVFLWAYIFGGWVASGWARVYSQPQAHEHDVIRTLPRLCDRLVAFRDQLGPGGYLYARAYDYDVWGRFTLIGGSEAVASVGPRTILDFQNGRDCLAAGIPA